MMIATKFGGFTSATVIKLLVSTIKLPSESSAMTLRLGKAAVRPSAKGIQSPMLQPKKFAPSRLKSDQKAVFDERLVTVSICSSTIGAKSFRQSKRFITNLRVGICRRVCHHEDRRVGQWRGPGFDDADVSIALSKIPYGGFSPVRLQTGIQPRPSSNML